LHVGAQPFHIVRWQWQVVLPAEVEDRLQAHAAIQWRCRSIRGRDESIMERFLFF